jgi:hypothetical protein
LPQLRRLLHGSGTVERCAEAIEALRVSIYQAVAATGNPSAAHRLLLRLVDGLAQTIYEPPPVAQTSEWSTPMGGFHDAVRAEARRFLERMEPFQPPPLPSFVPWHLPHYLYESSRRTVYYPDLDGLPEEIVPFQAELLGTSSQARTLDVLHAQLPAVLAHELFHDWRDVSGRLTRDSWHEEYAANRLAVSYVKRFCPDTLERTLSLADEVLERFAPAMDEGLLQTLARSEQPTANATGYGMDMKQAALVHLEMVRRLALRTTPLEVDVDDLLTSAPA